MGEGFYTVQFAPTEVDGGTRTESTYEGTVHFEPERITLNGKPTLSVREFAANALGNVINATLVKIHEDIRSPDEQTYVIDPQKGRACYDERRRAVGFSRADGTWLIVQPKPRTVLQIRPARVFNEMLLQVQTMFGPRAQPAELSELKDPCRRIVRPLLVVIVVLLIFMLIIGILGPLGYLD